MNDIFSLNYNDSQKASLEDYLSLESDEDRLEWLMKRPSSHVPVPEVDRSAEKRIPGCPSGLWLSHQVNAGRCYFSSYSESAMVQGISSFLCDLYSDRAPGEIISIHHTIAAALGLERLLSITRKRAIAVVVEYVTLIAHVEQKKLPDNDQTI